MMCTNNWPMLLDLSRDECKRILRSLELNAYSTVITAFRAQGDLSKPKKAILQDLQNILSISTERHRAEVRRATNDEKLSTIADNVSGSDVSSEWSIEGRRLVPLMPRLVPQTAFTVTANSAANAQAEKNLSLPPPSQTGNKDPNAPPPPVSSPPPTAGSGSPRLARPTSPNSNVVVLPSGMAIHIKGSLSASEEDEGPVAKKRRRSSSSSESLILSKPAAAATPMLVSKSQTVHPPAPCGIAPMVPPVTLPQAQATPMKITFTKSPAKTHTTVTPSQKVILVSSSQSGTSNILQRSLNVPMAKATSAITTTTTASMYAQRSSVVMTPQPSPSVTNGNLGNIITVATSNTMPSSAGSTPYITSNLSAIKPRAKTITATRPKGTLTGRSGMVIPVGAQQIPQSAQNIQIKSVSKPPIHIKQEGGMKIITQGVPSGTSKILPKPTASQMTPGRVLNITQGGRVIATTSRTTAANVVTVNPKTLQLTAIKGASGATVLTTAGRVATATGAKPNVIVVQKAQPKRAQTPTTPTIQVTKTGPGTSPFEKELMSFIQKQDTMKTNIKGSIIERKALVAKPGDPQKRTPMVVRQRLDPNMSEASRSSLLAELIHAVGIGPDGTPELVTTQQHEVVTKEDGTSEPQSVVIPAAQTEVITVTTKGADGHHWVDYDDGVPQVGTPGIKSLLTSQHAQPPVKTRIISAKPGDLDTIQLTQIPESQTAGVYRIESGGDAKSLMSGDVQYIDLSAQEEVVTTGDQSHPVSVQLTNAADLSNLTSLSPEVLGELDPQTGIFYATTPNDTSVSQLTLSTAVALTTQSMISSKEATARAVPEDFLSSALNQAQIDLDSYHFVEEDESTRAAATATSAAGDVALTGTPLVSILNPATSSSAAGFPTPPESSQDTESQNLSQDSESIIVEGEQIDNIVLMDQQEVVETTPTEVVEQSPVPLQDAAEGLTLPPLPPNTIVQPVTQPAPEPRKVVMSREPQIKTITLDQSGKTVMLETPRSIMVESANRLVGEPHMSSATGTRRVVTVEELRKLVQAQPPAGTTVRTVHKVIATSAPATYTVPSTSLLASTEVMTSDPLVNSDPSQPQPMTDEMEHDLLASPGSGSDSQMDHLGQRISKRKRKPPPAADDSPPPAGAAQWIRLAIGLLQRVCRFRGNKEKGELNASVWFLQPVDTTEVKDYLEVVESPMDFSTIREKLECGRFENWSDFHDDMMLVKDNCILYNPEGSTVRNDCDEVFSYFDVEYQKTLDRWHKMFASSPAGKKMKVDSKSPVRP